MIRLDFGCQNTIFGPSSNVRIGLSKVNIRYSVLVRMSIWDFEYQNTILGLSSNAKIGLRMSKSIFVHISNVKIRF